MPTYLQTNFLFLFKDVIYVKLYAGDNEDLDELFFEFYENLFFDEVLLALSTIHDLMIVDLYELF